MKKLRIFLTGSSGFIGKNILELLGEKYTILAPSHRELELTDEKKVERYLVRHAVDVVVHTANIGGNREEADVPNVAAHNLRIFFNLVRCNQYYKKFINLSSGTQYGKQASIIRVKETDLGKRIPADEFGLYKYICARYIEDSTLPIINLALFGIYGKYEPYEFRFISNALCRALFNMPITISQNARFDYIWAEDFVRILDYFLSHTLKHRTYNIGTGQQSDLLFIAKKVLEVTKKTLPIQVAKPGYKEEYTCDNGRLMDELGNFRFTILTDSLYHLYTYYQQNKRSLDKYALL